MKGSRARAVPWERCKWLKNSNHPSRLIHTSFRSHLESGCCVLTSGVWSGHINPTHWTRLLLSAHPWCRGLFPYLSPTLFPVVPTIPTRTPSLAQPRPAPSGGTKGTRMGPTYCPCVPSLSNQAHVPSEVSLTTPSGSSFHYLLSHILRLKPATLAAAKGKHRLP